MGTDEVGSLICSYIEQSQNPDIQDYGAGLLRDLRAGAAQRYFWELHYAMELGKLHNCRVLDIGCGFGWNAMYLALCGNNEIVALDIRETMTAPLDEFLSKLRSRGRNIPITTLTGDVCAMDFEPESFDAVYSNEAIEHIRDLDVMFGKCRQLLKPGGSFVFVNDSNALNSQTRTSTQEMWEMRDNSWACIEEILKERPIENQGIAPFAVMRARIIREANPTLTTDDVEMLAAATAGMVQAEIRELSIGFGPGTVLPVRPPLSWCRSPLTGEYCERLLDPYELQEMAAKNGLRGRIYHTYRRFPQSLLNRIQLRPLGDLLFNIRRQFALAGERIE